MSKRISILLAPALFPLLVALTGCGSAYGPNGNSLANSGHGVATGGSTDTTTPTSGDTGNTSSAATSTGPRLTGKAPLTFPIQGTGYNSQTVTVSANRYLKVKFTAGRQNRTEAATGRVWQYSILGVFLSAGGTAQPTPPLSTALNGGTPDTSPVIDLSGTFPNNCVSTNVSCRTQVTVTVSQPNNDVACIYYGIGCPYSHVIDNQAWNGTLTVETDDTNSL